MDYELFMKYDDDDVAAADYDAADDEDDDAYVDDSLTFCRICTTALQKSLIFVTKPSERNVDGLAVWMLNF